MLEELRLEKLDAAETPTNLARSTGELVLEMAIPGEDGLPKEIRIFKYGKHQSTKGTFTFDEESAKSVMKRASEYGNDFFFDYGHASLDEDAVDPAKAGRSAGSYRLQVINGELWTQGLQLTEEAKGYLRDRQYRYISPAFLHRGGKVVEFINAAFTNMPATLNQPPVVLERDETKPTEQKMEQLLAALGLSKSATEAEALSKLKAIQERGMDIAALTGKSDAAEQYGVINAWKVKADKMPEVNSKLEKLEAEIREEQVQKTIRIALKKGVLPPSLKEQAIELGRKDPKFLKAFLSEFKPLVNKEGKNEKTPGAPVIGLTNELTEVATRLGYDVKEVAKIAARGMPKPSKDNDEE